MITLDEAKNLAFGKREADTTRFVTGDELQRQCEQFGTILGHGRIPFRHRSWEFDPEVLVLRHTESGYELDLEQATTAAELLDWILQVGLKSGGDMRVDEAIVLLQRVAMLRGLGGLQGAFCPSGRAPDGRVNWGGI